MEKSWNVMEFVFENCVRTLLVGMPSLFKIYDSLAFDKSMVHIEFQKGSRLHLREVRLIPEKHERIHQERLQVNSITSAHPTIILTDTECNRLRLMSLKFPFALFLAGPVFAL